MFSQHDDTYLMKNLIYHHRTQATDAQGIHIREMCNAFERQGWTITKVALVHDEAVGKESRTEKKFQFISMLPCFLYEFLEIAYNLIGFFRLSKAIRKTNASFIYERYSIFNFAGVAASHIFRTPLILEVNAPLAEEKKKHGMLYLYKLAQFLETWNINHSFQTIAVTTTLKNILINNGALEEKIIVMQNGVNLDEYQGINYKKNDSDHITIGFIGWFRSWHGLKEVVAHLATPPLKEKIHLILVGDGPAREEIEQTISQYEAGSWVSITGAVDRTKVIDYLRKFDIALQPAATEYASPMKLIEYMAAGKAIVAVDQENIREILTHQKNALLFELNNWSQLANHISKLCADPDLRCKLGTAAQKTVREKALTWDANASRIIKSVGNI